MFAALFFYMDLQGLGRHLYVKHWLRNYQYDLTPGLYINFSDEHNLSRVHFILISALCFLLIRYPQCQLIEVNAHSLFSKWFSESGKLVCGQSVKALRNFTSGTSLFYSFGSLVV